MRQGEDYILSIKKAGVWVPIACEVSSSMNEDADMVLTTTRDNAGWDTSKPTMQRYSLDFEGVIPENTLGISFFELRRIKRERNLIEWKRMLTDLSYFEYGLAYISSISDSSAAGGDISFSMTLQGFGKPLEDLEGLIYVLGTDVPNQALVDELNQMLRVYG